VTPPLRLERKTARLFGLLRAEDFTDGARTRALAAGLRNGRYIGSADLANAFDRAAEEAFPPLHGFRQALAAVCGHAVLSGAGPSLFAVSADEHSARAAASTLETAGVPALAVRTLDARASSTTA
jgi:4-diphosphocytidyl-2C-methyl-D-erythritol kinase